jgi:hypothetical protein
MLVLKSIDVEIKLVNDQKSASEGSTCDCFCNSFFQFVLGLQNKTVADSQLLNVQKFLDYLPSVDGNTNSMLGHFTACN